MATTDAEYIHQKKGPRILGVFWAFYSVSAVMVSLRLCIRARMLKNIGLDDYIIVAAMVCTSQLILIHARYRFYRPWSPVIQYSPR